MDCKNSILWGGMCLRGEGDKRIVIDEITSKLKQIDTNVNIDSIHNTSISSCILLTVDK